VRRCHTRLLVAVTATSNGQPTVVLTTQYADDSDQRSSVSATIDGLDDFLTTYQYDSAGNVTQIAQTGQAQNSGDT